MTRLKEVQLTHFRLSEFRGQHLYLAVGLLLALDYLRDLLGVPIYVSAADGAMIRYGRGPSQHFYGRAIEVLISPETDPFFVVAMAKQAGFSGIGYYPQTASAKEGWARWHFDTRPDRTPETPATWSELDGRLRSLETGLAAYPGLPTVF